jgi:hypothetical protein
MPPLEAIEFLNDRDIRTRANKLGTFRARAIPQFQVTMRRWDMMLSLADGNGKRTPGNIQFVSSFVYPG